jgi:hypothetical protein
MLRFMLLLTGKCESSEWSSQPLQVVVGRWWEGKGGIVKSGLYKGIKFNQRKSTKYQRYQKNIKYLSEMYICNEEGKKKNEMNTKKT